MRRFFSIALAVALGAFSLSAMAAPAPQPGGAFDLDTLYARLAKTPYPEEASGILAEIQHIGMQSGSDAADLLMSRAQKARQTADLPLALKLYDAVVDLQPGWAEAWSERATTRYQTGDVNGAVADLAQTLKREPRDIDALAGLGAILSEAGDPDGALRAYDRALKLAPAYEPLKEGRAHAQTLLWSRSP